MTEFILVSYFTKNAQTKSKKTAKFAGKIREITCFHYQHSYYHGTQGFVIWHISKRVVL